MKRANLRDFEQQLKAKNILVFTSTDLERIFGWSKTAVRFLIHRYAKRGVIVRLKRDLYMLAGVSVPDAYIANRLYEPSYVSLESALSYHGIIPEMVYAVTSMSAKTARRFTAAGREYEYHKIKTTCYAGYDAVSIGDFTCLIAEPEKAIVDYCYLVVRGQRKPLDLTRMRLQELRSSKLEEYASLFGDLRLKKAVNLILETMRHSL